MKKIVFNQFTKENHAINNLKLIAGFLENCMAFYEKGGHYNDIEYVIIEDKDIPHIEIRKYKCGYGRLYGVDDLISFVNSLPANPSCMFINDPILNEIHIHITG